MLALAAPAAAQEEAPPAADPPAEVVEGPGVVVQQAPAPLALPEPPVLSYSTREPLLALGDVRLARTRRSNAGLMIAAGLELAAGTWMVVGSAAGEGGAGDVGAMLVVGGFAHGLTTFYQLDMGQRRHATFYADFAAVADNPEAWDALAKSMRHSTEREARSHAFASGFYASLLTFGALSAVLASGEIESADAGAALAFVGAVGLTHHVSRWRASVRIANDLDVLDARIPTVLPAGY